MSQNSQHVLSTKLQPIMGKENKAIEIPYEKCWVIELATDDDILAHPHYEPWPEPRTFCLPLDRMTTKRNSYCSGLSDTNSIQGNYHVKHEPDAVHTAESNVIVIRSWHSDVPRVVPL